MAFANVRDGTTLRQLNVGQGAALLGLIGLVVMAAGWRWEPQRALPAIALLATGYSTAVYFAFVAMHVWLPLVTPLLLEIPLLTFGALLLQYFHSRAAWREIFAIAQKYVPFEASKFLSELEQRRHANDPVFGTILSSDAANFTKVVEGFGPELPRLVELLDEYFSALSGPVEASIPKGMIIDTAGDGMLAVWQDPDDSLAARRAACIAACAIRAAVEAFNRAHPNTPLPTRLGLHAGNLALADVMAGPRAFYKAIGDVPNTASRIEALNKRLGTSLLASGPVVVGLEDLLLIRPCGRFKLPGKQDALEIVEILGLREQALPTEPALLAKFEAALHLVEAQQWPQAAAAFTAVLAEFPGDGPSAFYRTWCEKKHTAREIDTDSSIIVIDTK